MKRKKSKILIAGAIAFIAGFLTTVRGAPVQDNTQSASASVIIAPPTD
jgi:hypothetical protein